MASLKELTVKIAADTKGLDQGIDDASGKVTSFGSLFGGLAKTAVAATAAAGAAVGAIGFEAIQAGAKLEQSNIAFKTLLGSAENAGAFLKELSAFASTTPFEFQGLQDASKQMLAFGFESKEIIPTLTGVGDALSAVGKVEALPNVILQLGQMQAKGKASREELNILAEHGIPVWQLLADTLGTTVSGAMDRVGKGALSADDAISALLKGIENSNAGGAMAAQMESLNGAWSNVMDTFTQAFQKLGLELIPSIGKPAVDVAKQIVDAFATVVDAIVGVEGKTGDLKTVWGVDLAAIAAKAKSVFNEIKTFMGPVFDQIVRIVQEATAIVNDLMAIPGMKQSVEVVWLGIKAIVEGTWIALKAIISGALTVIEGALKVFHSAITLDWQTTKDGLAMIVEGMWTAITGVFSGGVTAIKNTLIGLKDSVLSVFSDIGDELVGNSIVPDEIVDPTIGEFERMGAGAKQATHQLALDVDTEFSAVGTTLATNKTEFETWRNGIDDAVKNLDIGGKIFSGAFAPGKWKDTLKGIATDFLDLFLKPIKDGINDFIAGGLKDLSGALSGIGSQLSGIFTGGGGAAGSTTSTQGSGGGLSSILKGLGSGGGDPVTGAISAGIQLTDMLLSHFGRKRAEATANAIEENTRLHMLLFADYRASVGFFQNNELQEQTANLEYIVANGDEMKATLWSIRDILSGGISISGVSSSGVADMSDAVDAGMNKSVRGANGKGGRGSLLDMLDSLLGAPGFPSPSRSRTRTPQPGDTDSASIGAPMRSRIGQQPPSAEEIGESVRDALAARNPLAVVAAELGNPLAQLVTGSNFLPTAVSDQTAAIDAQTEAINTNDAEQTAAIQIASDTTNTRLSEIHATLHQMVTDLRAALNREIVLSIDGQEIARAVGAGQEALRATA